MQILGSKLNQDFVQRLSLDPQIASAIAEMRSLPDEGLVHVTPFRDVLLSIFRLSGKFMNRTQASRLLELIDLLSFLGALSVIHGKNLFSNPAIQQDFRRNFAQAIPTAERMYALAAEYVNGTLASESA